MAFSAADTRTRLDVHGIPWESLTLKREGAASGHLWRQGKPPIEMSAGILRGRERSGYRRWRRQSHGLSMPAVSDADQVAILQNLSSGCRIGDRSQAGSNRHLSDVGEKFGVDGDAAVGR